MGVKGFRRWWKLCRRCYYPPAKTRKTVFSLTIQKQLFFWSVKRENKPLLLLVRENLRLFGYVSTTAALKHPLHLLCPPSRLRVGYPTVYNISNSLSSVWLGRSCSPFPCNYRLVGFLKWGFWRNNTFLLKLKGKTKDILARSSYSQSHQSCLTHLVAKISSYLM